MEVREHVPCGWRPHPTGLWPATLPTSAGESHMTELSSTLIGRGLVQSLSRSSLRTQGPITPGLESEKRPLLECRSESPRRRDERLRSRWGPFVRRDDLLA